MTRIWTSAMRSLWRDWRAGDLRLLLVAVTLAVAALTSVAFFADRLQGGLQRDARALLGGDVVVSSDQPTPKAVTGKAAELGLITVQTLGFPTMARAPDAAGGAATLVALKAVAPGYPLRGRLRVADSPELASGAEQWATGIPLPGTVWVDAPLLESLQLKMNASLLLGDAAFTVAKIVVNEPDRGGGFMNFAPRVMLNAADLPSTRLVQPASRVGYRLAMVGPDASVTAFSSWADAHIKSGATKGVRLESFESGRPEMRQTLDRAGKFLNLVALLAALLSAVAIAIAARGFAARHLDDCAMLRVLGQPQRAIAWGYAIEFCVVGVAASVLGLGLGYALHEVLLAVLKGLVESSLPPPSGWPVGLGLGMGLTLMVAFGLPPVLQLAQVPPLRVIRRDVGGLKATSVGVMAVGVLGFAALLMAISKDAVLGGIAVGGFAAAIGLFAGLSWLAVQVLRTTVKEDRAPRWLVIATRQISARPALAVVQTSALAVGMLALMLLVLLRTDLIDSWRKATPVDAPNRFVINLQPEQVSNFKATLAGTAVEKYDLFPMIRGRLLAINGQVTGPDSFTDDRAKRLVDREFNLSNAAEQPAHNKVVAGAWTVNEVGAISVEEGIAKTLNLKLGDTLKFDVGGQSVESRITSLRSVDWGSMRANFFVMYPVADLAGVPATYMSAFKAPSAPGFDNALVRQFPNITSVDMSQTIGQVQRVLSQVSRAIEFLFGFTLLAGLVVLFATLGATREERAREYAIMRALGASSRLLRQVQRAELAGVGLLAGFLASLVAMLVGWALAKFVFEFAWTASAWVPVAGGLVGAALALAAGWWGLREVLERPVIQTLRQAAQ